MPSAPPPPSPPLPPRPVPHLRLCSCSSTAASRAACAAPSRSAARRSCASRPRSSQPSIPDATASDQLRTAADSSLRSPRALLTCSQGRVVLWRIGNQTVPLGTACVALRACLSMGMCDTYDGARDHGPDVMHVLPFMSLHVAGCLGRGFRVHRQQQLQHQRAKFGLPTLSMISRSCSRRS